MLELRLIALGRPCISSYGIVFILKGLSVLKLFSWYGEVFNLTISKKTGYSCLSLQGQSEKASRSRGNFTYWLWTAQELGTACKAWLGTALPDLHFAQPGWGDDLLQRMTFVLAPSLGGSCCLLSPPNGPPAVSRKSVETSCDSWQFSDKIHCFSEDGKPF